MFGAKPEKKDDENSQATHTPVFDRRAMKAMQKDPDYVAEKMDSMKFLPPRIMGDHTIIHAAQSLLKDISEKAGIDESTMNELLGAVQGYTIIVSGVTLHSCMSLFLDDKAMSDYIDEELIERGVSDLDNVINDILGKGK